MGRSAFILEKAVEHVVLDENPGQAKPGPLTLPSDEAPTLRYPRGRGKISPLPLWGRVWGEGCGPSGRFPAAVSRFVALALLFIAGCASAPYQAPIRDAKQVRTPPPAAAKPLPPARPGYYRIQAGDTLYKIAFENGLDYQALAFWNGLSDPNLIKMGEELRLSAPVEAVKTAPLPAQATFAGRPAPPSPASPPVAAPTPVASEDADAAPGSWIWPAKGEVVTRFNSGESSKGIDVANRRGTPVLAAAPGRVVYAGSGLRGYGKLSIIKHSKTLLSAYGHQDEIYVKEGQLVSQSQVIGRMGDTDADRVKLHFEIREQGKPVDPINYLPNIGGEKWGVE